MICISISGSFSFVQQQVKEASQKASLLEFRLDLFKDFSFEELKKLRKELFPPVIFTLRKKSQGGNYEKTEKERLEELRKYATLLPDYLDLEFEVPKAFFEEIAKNFPSIQKIASYHNFSETPSDLEKIFQELKKFPAELCKIACKANSTNDSLRMLSFLSYRRPLLAIPMGEKGIVGRILGPRMGAPWTFASLSHEGKTAEGQLLCEELFFPYPIHKITSQTTLYGLIGKSIENSFGHLTHNRVFQTYGIDALYVKMPVEETELGKFLDLAKSIGFQGLSVTMPFKEKILPYLDSIDEKAKNIGAVNTLVLRQRRWVGYNTDGEAALDVLEKKQKVFNKKVIVLGAGGAAKAIIYEAKLRGARVLVLNRTKEKADQLAALWGVESASLEEMAKQGLYDILINATANFSPIPPETLLPNRLVMDVHNRPKMTDFLLHAQEKGCSLVYGYEMFFQQAIGQYRHWLFSLAKEKALPKILLDEILKRID